MSLACLLLIGKCIKKVGPQEIQTQSKKATFSIEI